MIGRAMGVDSGLVQPVKAPDYIPEVERPRYTSLHTARAEQELGWRPVEADEAVTAMIALP